jgi:amidophosphoribosyltransferase
MLMKTRKGPKLIAFSDTHKIRPLVYGRHEDSFMVASETVAFDHLGYEYIGDVKGGEAIIFDEDGMHRERVRKGIPRHCIFEWIYFSRPSSIIEGEEVYKFRWNVGWRQADDEISSGLWTPSMFDAFLGVPDSGAAYIHGCCSRLVQEALEHGKISPRDAVKLMSEQGLDKNKYVGRTFIAILGERKKMLQGKFNPIRSVVEGKRVVDWDDTSIRGNTQIHKNQALRRAGAKEVHNRFIRVEHPCFFGIDMTTKNQFIASGKDDQELAEALGADSVMSPDVERILVPSLTDIPYEHLCTGCLNGNYATDVSELLEAASRNCSGRPYENDDQSI